MASDHSIADTKFYIRFCGRVQGPFDVDELRAMAGCGTFSPLHSVSQDGKDWQRAAHHPELFPSPVASIPKTSTDSAGVAEGPASTVASAPPVGPAQSDTLPFPSDAVWHYTYGPKFSDRRFGPVTFSRLKVLAEIGQLTANNLIWREGMQEWVSAAQIPGLLTTVSNSEQVQGRPRATVSVEAVEHASKTSYAVQSAASLVCGLIGLFFAGGIMGLAAAIGALLALSGMDRSGNSDGRGMAYAGAILGLIDVVGWFMYARTVGIL